MRSTGQDGRNVDQLRINVTGTAGASDKGATRHHDVRCTAPNTQDRTNDLNCVAA